VPVLPAGKVGQEKGGRLFEGSAGAPLPGGAGLESSGLPTRYHQVTEAFAMLDFGKKLLSTNVYAIMLPTRQIGYKKMNLLGVNLGEACLPNHF
jgi:hypothetical protein